jgi:hypothetical protein
VTLNSANFNASTDGQIVVQGSGTVTINIVGGGTLPNGGGPDGNMPSAIFEAGLGGFNMCSNGLPGNPGQLYTAGTQAATCDNGTCTGSTCTGSPAQGSPTTYPITGIPSNMQVVYAGTGQMRVGGAPNALVIYMPEAPFYQPGGAVGLSGSIVSNSFEDDSNSPFYFDTQLLNTVAAAQTMPFKLIGFTWSKY